MKRLSAFLASCLVASSVLATQTATPFHHPSFNLSTGTDPRLIDATAEKFATIVRAPKAGDVSGFTLFTGTVTAGDSTTGSLQDVSLTTGDPDGTPDQSGVVVVVDGNDDTFLTYTMSANRAVVFGELFALVVAWTSWTDGNMNFLMSAEPSLGNNVYPDLFTSAWSKSSQTPMVVLIYSDGSRALTWGTIPGRVTTEAVSTGTTPDEVGNVWTPTAPLTVAGCFMHLEMDGDESCVLYDTDGTSVLASGTNDKDNRTSTGGNVYLIPFATPVAVAAGSQYRIVAKPTSATSGTVYVLNVTVAADLDAWWWGQAMHGTTRVDAGSWSQTTTKQYQVWPVISAAGSDTGGGAGGVSAARIQGGD